MTSFIPFRISDLKLWRALLASLLLFLLAGAAHAGTVSIGSGDLNATCASTGNARVYDGFGPQKATTWVRITSSPSGANATLQLCDGVGAWKTGQTIWFGPTNVATFANWVVLITDTEGAYGIDVATLACPEPFDFYNVNAPCKGDSSKSSGKRSVASQPALVSTPDPNLPSTGELLNQQGYSVSATAGLKSGMQFKRVDAAGVGNQSVLDMGFIDAIDVWGGFSGSVTVCFPQHGQIIFLDAATSPRTATTLASQQVNGSTCATITSAGTVVLVSAPAAQPDSVTDCTVTATHNLNFRATPGGRRIGRVTKGSSLTVLSRTDYWFQVDSNGATGWISAGYVIKTGDCG